jgi:mobilome CxxCx(11)CxxC protein
MVPQTTVDAIRQKKLDSLAAKHLHSGERLRLNKWSQAVDVLALGVPIAYFAVRYLAKDTAYHHWVEIIWELLAASLLVLVVIKMVYRWQERSQQHSELLRENISLVTEAAGLLASSQPTAESVTHFLRSADRSEHEDRELLGSVDAGQRQFAYREALKELEPGNSAIVCPICTKSPYSFESSVTFIGWSRCPACGNILERKAVS